MFEGFGQLECIHVRDNYGTVYDLYLRGDYGAFTRIAFRGIEHVGKEILDYLREGRLYANATDLRDTFEDRWNDTLGRFRLEDIELVELGELPLERIRRYFVHSFPDNRGRRSIVTEYMLGHNLYSVNGRLVVRKGKMRRAEGDYLLQQSKKRKYYAMRKDLRTNKTSR